MLRRGTAKKHVYSTVFNENFNLSFHSPKKDQCDLCCQFQNEENLAEDENSKFTIHQKNKNLAKTERDIDTKNINKKTAIITYDLQNVFALPRADVSSFYYKRKFAVYNLTGHFNLNKLLFHLDGSPKWRTGNDLASG